MIDKIFNKLSFKHLPFGQTCKAMQKMAGEYFQEHISSEGIVVEADPDHIFTSINCKRLEIPYFMLFLKRVFLCARGTEYGGNYKKCPNKHNFDRIQMIDSNIDQSAINYIKFYGYHFNCTNIDRIKNILNKVEHIDFRLCYYFGDFYDGFLKYCGNLKRMEMNHCDLGPRDEYTKENVKLCYPTDDDECTRNANLWMRYNYPKLVHLKLNPLRKDIVHEIKDFLDRHPNIRSFATSTKFICDNQEQLLQSTAQLDVFTVKRSIHQKDHGLEETCNILKRLYAQGFYRKLHFISENKDEEAFVQAAGISGRED